MLVRSSATLSSRLSLVALACAAGVLVLASGCGGSKAAAAQTPPPMSLSEPVRPMAEQREEPAVPVPSIPSTASNEDFAAQKTGESRELPPFVPPAQTVSTPVTASSTAPAGGRYHTLAKGETLYAVARMYNVKPKTLLDANQFKDPNKLAVGTKVFVP